MWTDAGTFFFWENSPLPLKFGAPLDDRINKCHLEQTSWFNFCFNIVSALQRQMFTVLDCVAPFFIFIFICFL